MFLKRTLLLAFACLSLLVYGGCKQQDFGLATIATTSQMKLDMSVRDLLHLDEGSILAVKILRMGDGYSETVHKKEEIARIFERLGKVKVTVDLGTSGYTPTGYSLVFSRFEEIEEYAVSIQLDVDIAAYHAAFDGHYYEIDDAAGKELLNDYFRLKRYQ